MPSNLPKATRATLFTAGILLGCSVTDHARADWFRVELSGTFTSGTPFTGSFLVNTAAASVLHQSVGGLALTGYQDAAISGLSISADGTTFTLAEISDRNAPGQPPAAVFFSQDLAEGASPSIWMFLEGNMAGELTLGQVGCGVTCSFTDLLQFYRDRPFADDRGFVTVSVLGFAGTPGATSCRGQSTASLSNRYGDLGTAATALGYSSVKALQTAITLFCGG